MSAVVRRLSILFLALSLSSVVSAQAPLPKLSAYDLEQAHRMLEDAYKEVKKNYYDATYHGVDLDARLHEYDAKLKDCRTIGETLRVIEAFLSVLHDSHTYFIPPMRGAEFETGYRMQMIGDKCVITEVKPGTDAASKLHPGDVVLRFDTFDVNRGDITDIRYFFNVLAPAPRSQLILKGTDGAMRNELVSAAITKGRRTYDLASAEGADYWQFVRRAENENARNAERLTEFNEGTIWRMPDFDISMDTLDHVFHMANKHAALVIDLRGNPGGSIASLEWLLGRFFDHDVKIADVVARKQEKPRIAKPSGSTFKGKLVVIVDDESASAAELFARVIQLEHRGTVIGDRTPGYVMEARTFADSQGLDRGVTYEFSVTDANLIMADGKSLEGVGVTPDGAVLPAPADLAAGNDPVLARAAAIAGIPLTPEKAGKLFPYLWPQL